MYISCASCRGWRSSQWVYMWCWTGTRLWVCLAGPCSPWPHTSWWRRARSSSSWASSAVWPPARRTGVCYSRWDGKHRYTQIIELIVIMHGFNNKKSSITNYLLTWHLYFDKVMQILIIHKKSGWIKTIKLKQSWFPKWTNSMVHWIKLDNLFYKTILPSNEWYLEWK